MKEAEFYETLNQNEIRCLLCPHHCLIQPGKTGICKVRKNIDGVLYSLVYGKPIAQSVDPIEKKPLFHFYPGSSAFSIATVGCNLHCLHCQNADISQVNGEKYPSKEVSPKNIIDAALKSGAKSIAYTYTEPTIFYEYAYDVATLAKKNDLKNVFVTNGYIEEEPLKRIAPLIDAANIDLKGMSESFYTKICGGHLEKVLDTIKRYYNLGIWIELTTLIIPTYNDDSKALSAIAEFIADINTSIPWHITGFYPTYKLLDVPSTPIALLDKAENIGKEAGLHHIYKGNRGRDENTYCPNCGKQLISRYGFSVSQNITKNNKCPNCGTSISGIHLQ